MKTYAAEKETKRYRMRFLASVVVLLMVVVGFVATLIVYIQRMDRTLTEENRARLSEVSEHVGLSCLHLIDEQQIKLRTAVKGLETARSSVYDYLGSLAEDFNFEFLGFAGQDGVFKAEGLTGTINLSEHFFFQTALNEGATGISELTRVIFWDRAVTGLMMAEPCLNGAIVALMDLSRYDDMVQVSSFDGKGYSYIIDREGNLVLHARIVQYGNYFQSLRFMEFGKGFSAEQMEADIADGKEGMSVYSELGTEKYVYYRPLDRNGWTVVTTVPKNFVTEKTALLTKELIYISVAAVVVLFALLLFIGLQFMKLESRRRANRSMSAFFANMSHDMRTPMNAIIGMTAIADKHAGEPEIVHDCLRKVTSSGKHLLGLINDILDMSRIENDKLSLIADDMSLADVVENAVNISYPIIRQKNQHFTAELKNVRHDRLRGDALRLAQIFNNILSNAVKFTPEGGAIRWTIEEEPSEETNCAFRFVFRDSGIGMNKDFLKKIFSPFARAQDSKVDKTEGSGLGMAITKRIVDQMGGTIDVTSTEGEGTEFVVRLTFPVGSQPLCAAEGVAAVLDRDAGRRAETERSLCGLGVRVVPASELSGQSGNAVLFVDECALDDVSSLSTYGENVRVACCVWDREACAEKAKHLKIGRFIQKPLFPSVLLRAMSDDADKERPQSDRFDFRNKRVLIVEDNPLNSEIAVTLLREAGAETDSAENGEIGVKMFKESQIGWYDLVLMDIQMPVMNGYEAARAIRAEERPDAGLPVMAMSANAFSEDIAAAKAAGITGYLTKPIELDVWMSQIDLALGSAARED